MYYTYKSFFNSYWFENFDFEIYQIKNPSIKKCNRYYSTLQNEFELVLNDDSDIILINENESIPKHRFNLVSISDLPKLSYGNPIGII